MYFKSAFLGNLLETKKGLQKEVLLLRFIKGKLVVTSIYSNFTIKETNQEYNEFLY